MNEVHSSLMCSVSSLELPNGVAGMADCQGLQCDLVNQHEPGNPSYCLHYWACLRGWRSKECRMMFTPTSHASATRCLECTLALENVNPHQHPDLFKDELPYSNVSVPWCLERSSQDPTIDRSCEKQCLTDVPMFDYGVQFIAVSQSRESQTTREAAE
jgi:hypothetical protein